jgi:hypothetical protein
MSQVSIPVTLYQEEDDVSDVITSKPEEQTFWILIHFNYLEKMPLVIRITYGRTKNWRLRPYNTNHLRHMSGISIRCAPRANFSCLFFLLRKEALMWGRGTQTPAFCFGLVSTCECVEGQDSTSAVWPCEVVWVFASALSKTSQLLNKCFPSASRESSSNGRARA